MPWCMGQVLSGWESIVNRVAKREVGEKIVCGKSAMGGGIVK